MSYFFRKGLLHKFNENHDPDDGRFASGGGSSGAGDGKKEDKYKQRRMEHDEKKGYKYDPETKKRVLPQTLRTMDRRTGRVTTQHLDQDGPSNEDLDRKFQDDDEKEAKQKAKWSEIKDKPGIAGKLQRAAHNVRGLAKLDGSPS